VSKPTLTAIVTGHKQSPFAIMNNLANQTVKPAQVLVGVSEFPLPWVVPSFPFPFTVLDFPTVNDFGYSKRNMLAMLATSDYLGFFCQDDSYDGDYIEQMLKAVENTRAIAAYCQWDDSVMGDKLGGSCSFHTDSSTLGNFIINREAFERLGGFLESPRGHGLRDGHLIERIRQVAESIARVNITLYHHNKPYEAGIRVTSWGKEV
jgi:GT2 family glycosyltransferase